MSSDGLINSLNLKAGPVSPDASPDTQATEHGNTARALEAVALLPDFNETLKRLLARISRILQASKCVFLLHAPQENELQALPPALGFTYEQLAPFHVKLANDSVAGQVFKSGIAATVDDVSAGQLGEAIAKSAQIYNGACVPLVVEKRDEDNRVIDRNTIGVLYVFNKAKRQKFNKEDLDLLTLMSFSAASILKSARDFLSAVQESQGLLNTIENFSLGLVVIGLNGRILQINSAARSMIGIPSSVPIYGVPYAVAMLRHESLFKIVTDSLNDGSPTEVSGEVTLPVPPGSVEEGPKDRIYQAQCAPALGGDGREAIGVALVLNDITEIRNVERMKTAFISTVSHELRTPLTSIKGFIETLLSDTEGFYDNETKTEFYRIINTECDRLTRLIEDLLNVSRIEQGKAMQLNLSDVNFMSVAEKVLASQRAYTKPDRHQLELAFPPNFPLVEADQDKIDQILTNLVSNAIKYSPRGGLIRVIGKPLADKHFVEVRVEDHGMGIPKEHIAKVWERFHRVDNRDNREIGGTGIGLFLVKSLVEAHHGQVGIESEYGVGSTFYFIIPIKQPATEVA